MFTVHYRSVACHHLSQHQSRFEILLHLRLVIRRFSDDTTRAGYFHLMEAGRGVRHRATRRIILLVIPHLFPLLKSHRISTIRRRRRLGFRSEIAIWKAAVVRLSL
jgi:hypothetical protein